MLRSPKGSYRSKNSKAKNNTSNQKGFGLKRDIHGFKDNDSRTSNETQQLNAHADNCPLVLSLNLDSTKNAISFSFQAGMEWHQCQPRHIVRTKSDSFQFKKKI